MLEQPTVQIVQQEITIVENVTIESSDEKK
jgi:hypothetical protein